MESPMKAPTRDCCVLYVRSFVNTHPCRHLALPPEFIPLFLFAKCYRPGFSPVRSGTQNRVPGQPKTERRWLTVSSSDVCSPCSRTTRYRTSCTTPFLANTPALPQHQSRTVFQHESRPDQLSQRSALVATDSCLTARVAEMVILE